MFFNVYKNYNNSLKSQLLDLAKYNISKLFKKKYLKDLYKGNKYYKKEFIKKTCYYLSFLFLLYYIFFDI